ncbi:MAG: hypothetical protein IPJ46_04375 [Anaerolineales bacterium]|nr:hypothetical protein [Anaerolineales bacterium]
MGGASPSSNAKPSSLALKGWDVSAALNIALARETGCSLAEGSAVAGLTSSIGRGLTKRSARS